MSKIIRHQTHQFCNHTILIGAQALIFKPVYYLSVSGWMDSGKMIEYGFHIEPLYKILCPCPYSFQSIISFKFQEQLKKFSLHCFCLFVNKKNSYLFLYYSDYVAINQLPYPKLKPLQNIPQTLLKLP